MSAIKYDALNKDKFSQGINPARFVQHINPNQALLGAMRLDGGYADLMPSPPDYSKELRREVAALRSEIAANTATLASVLEAVQRPQVVFSHLQEEPKKKKAGRKYEIVKQWLQDNEHKLSSMSLGDMRKSIINENKLKDVTTAYIGQIREQLYGS